MDLLLSVTGEAGNEGSSEKGSTELSSSPNSDHDAQEALPRQSVHSSHRESQTISGDVDVDVVHYSGKNSAGGYTGGNTIDDKVASDVHTLSRKSSHSPSQSSSRTQPRREAISVAMSEDIEKSVDNSDGQIISRKSSLPRPSPSIDSRQRSRQHSQSSSRRQSRSEFQSCGSMSGTIEDMEIRTKILENSSHICSPSNSNSSSSSREGSRSEEMNTKMKDGMGEGTLSSIQSTPQPQMQSQTPLQIAKGSISVTKEESEQYTSSKAPAHSREHSNPPVEVQGENGVNINASASEDDVQSAKTDTQAVTSGNEANGNDCDNEDVLGKNKANGESSPTHVHTQTHVTNTNSEIINGTSQQQLPRSSSRGSHRSNGIENARSSGDRESSSSAIRFGANKDASTSPDKGNLRPSAPVAIDNVNAVEETSDKPQTYIRNEGVESSLERNEDVQSSLERNEDVESSLEEEKSDLVKVDFMMEDDGHSRPHSIKEHVANNDNIDMHDKDTKLQRINVEVQNMQNTRVHKNLHCGKSDLVESSLPPISQSSKQLQAKPQILYPDMQVPVSLTRQFRSDLVAGVEVHADSSPDGGEGEDVDATGKEPCMQQMGYTEEDVRKKSSHSAELSHSKQKNLSSDEADETNTGLRTSIKTNPTVTRQTHSTTLTPMSSNTPSSQPPHRTYTEDSEDVGKNNQTERRSEVPPTPSSPNTTRVINSKRPHTPAVHTSEQSHLVPQQANKVRLQRSTPPGAVDAPVSPSPTNGLVCKFCSKDFANQSSLNKHMTSHSSDRPYSCSHCFKSFKRVDHLTSHTMTHRVIKAYKCMVGLCMKRYRDVRTLKRHYENVHLLFDEGMPEITAVSEFVNSEKTPLESAHAKDPPAISAQPLGNTNAEFGSDDDMEMDEHNSNRESLTHCNPVTPTQNANQNTHTQVQQPSRNAYTYSTQKGGVANEIRGPGVVPPFISQYANQNRTQYNTSVGMSGCVSGVGESLDRKSSTMSHSDKILFYPPVSTHDDDVLRKPSTHDLALAQAKREALMRDQSLASDYTHSKTSTTSLSADMNQLREQDSRYVTGGHVNISGPGFSRKEAAQMRNYSPYLEGTVEMDERAHIDLQQPRNRNAFMSNVSINSGMGERGISPTDTRRNRWLHDQRSRGVGVGDSEGASMSGREGVRRRGSIGDGIGLSTNVKDRAKSVSCALDMEYVGGGSQSLTQKMSVGMEPQSDAHVHDLTRHAHTPTKGGDASRVQEIDKTSSFAPTAKHPLHQQLEHQQHDSWAHKMNRRYSGGEGEDEGANMWHAGVSRPNSRNADKKVADVVAGACVSVTSTATKDKSVQKYPGMDRFHVRRYNIKNDEKQPQSGVPSAITQSPMQVGTTSGQLSQTQGTSEAVNERHMQSHLLNNRPLPRPVPLTRCSQDMRPKHVASVASDSKDNATVLDDQTNAHNKEVGISSESATSLSEDEARAALIDTQRSQETGKHLDTPNDDFNESSMSGSRSASPDYSESEKLGEIRVGKEYQADMAYLERDYPVPDAVGIGDHNEMRWDPGSVDDETLDTFFELLKSLPDHLPLGMVWRLEDAMDVLRTSPHITHAIVCLFSERIRQKYTKVSVWSEDEKDVFHNTFAKLGKNFFLIQKAIPSKTIPEVVSYYYRWKKDENGIYRHLLSMQRYADHLPDEMMTRKRPAVSDVKECEPKRIAHDNPRSTRTAIRRRSAKEHVCVNSRENGSVRGGMSDSSDSDDTTDSEAEGRKQARSVHNQASEYKGVDLNLRMATDVDRVESVSHATEKSNKADTDVPEADSVNGSNVDAVGEMNDGDGSSIVRIRRTSSDHNSHHSHSVTLPGKHHHKEHKHKGNRRQLSRVGRQSSLLTNDFNRSRFSVVTSSTHHTHTPPHTQPKEMKAKFVEADADDEATHVITSNVQDNILSLSPNRSVKASVDGSGGDSHVYRKQCSGASNEYKDDPDAIHMRQKSGTRKEIRAINASHVRMYRCAHCLATESEVWRKGGLGGVVCENCYAKYDLIENHQCGYCGTNESDLWRRGQHFTLLCVECYSRILHEQPVENECIEQQTLAPTATLTSAPIGQDDGEIAGVYKDVEGAEGEHSGGDKTGSSKTATGQRKSPKLSEQELPLQQLLQDRLKLQASLQEESHPSHTPYSHAKQVHQQHLQSRSHSLPHSPGQPLTKVNGVVNTLAAPSRITLTQHRRGPPPQASSQTLAQQQAYPLSQLHGQTRMHSTMSPRYSSSPHEVADKMNSHWGADRADRDVKGGESGRQRYDESECVGADVMHQGPRHLQPQSHSVPTPMTFQQQYQQTRVHPQVNMSINEGGTERSPVRTGASRGSTGTVSISSTGRFGSQRVHSDVSARLHPYARTASMPKGTMIDNSPEMSPLPSPNMLPQTSMYGGSGRGMNMKMDMGRGEPNPQHYPQQQYNENNFEGRSVPSVCRGEGGGSSGNQYPPGTPGSPQSHYSATRSIAQSNINKKYYQEPDMYTRDMRDMRDMHDVRNIRDYERDRLPVPASRMVYTSAGEDEGYSPPLRSYRHRHIPGGTGRGNGMNGDRWETQSYHSQQPHAQAQSQAQLHPKQQQYQTQYSSNSLSLSHRQSEWEGEGEREADEVRSYNSRQSYPPSWTQPKRAHPQDQPRLSHVPYHNADVYGMGDRGGPYTPDRRPVHMHSIGSRVRGNPPYTQRQNTNNVRPPVTSVMEQRSLSGPSQYATHFSPEREERGVESETYYTVNEMEQYQPGPHPVVGPVFSMGDD
eukprot:CFRG1499T1